MEPGKNIYTLYFHSFELKIVSFDEQKFVPGSAATLYVVSDPDFLDQARFSDEYLESMDNW